MKKEKSEKKTSKTEEKAEKKKPEKISQEDYEKKVLELAKQGLTSEKIGQKLRIEGIHPKDYKKKLSIILKEKKVFINPDLTNVEAKLKAIKIHYEKNHQDKKAMREAERLTSHLRKLRQYFKVQ